MLCYKVATDCGRSHSRSILYSADSAHIARNRIGRHSVMPEGRKKRSGRNARTAIIAAIITASAGLAGTALTVFHGQGAIAPPINRAIGPTSPPSPTSSAGTRRQPSGESTPATAAYVRDYTNQVLTLPDTDLGDSSDCGQVSYIDFGVPMVVSAGQSSDEADLYVTLTCSASPGVQITPQQGAAVSLAGIDSASGCLSAIQDEPIGESATINLGASVCVRTSPGLVAYFRWNNNAPNGNAQLVVSSWLPTS